MAAIVAIIDGQYRVAIPADSSLLSQHITTISLAPAGVSSTYPIEWTANASGNEAK